MQEDVQQLDELVAGMLGAYLGAKAAEKGISLGKKAVQTKVAKVSTRIKRANIIKKAKQTEVGSAERKAALKQSKKLKKDLEKRVQQIKKQKPKPQTKPKKRLSSFKRNVKRAIRRVKR
jgi:hypothetical protein